jgi:hypothetical protein
MKPPLPKLNRSSIKDRPMDARIRYSSFVTAALAVVVLGGCYDDQEFLDEQPPIRHARTCNEKQIEQGKCEDPPPPPPEPVDPYLPPVTVQSLKGPLRLDVTPTGRVLFTDSKLNMVLSADPSSLWPNQGLELDWKPLGIAFLDNMIYVGNADDETIAVFDAVGGGYLGDFGSGAVRYPTDLAADFATGTIVALDGLRREVRVFATDGTLIRTISGPGTTNDRLTAPVAVGLDPIREWVLVSDFGANGANAAAVKVFGYDGTYVTAIPGAGTCNWFGCQNGFSRPQSVTVDVNGRVYIPDAVLAQVFVYTFDGTNWTRNQTLGELGFYQFPTDAAIGWEGDLLVVSRMLGEITPIRGMVQP